MNEDRRTFIRQITAAALLGSNPSVYLPERGIANSIRLIVRADDMGNTWDTTLGIIKAHRDGIVTSTSLMAASPFFQESVELCKANPKLAVGIHITLANTRTRPVLPPEEVPSIVTPAGFLYETKNDLENAQPDAGEMEREIRAQIRLALASGLKFSYIDNHRGGARDSIILNLCREYKLIFGRDYDGALYGYKSIQFIPEHWPRQKLPDGEEVYYSAPALSPEDEQKYYNNLGNIEPGDWIAVVHPGLAHPERRSVTELLCSGKTWETIKKKNIQLISYNDLWNEEFDSK